MEIIILLYVSLPAILQLVNMQITLRELVLNFVPMEHMELIYLQAHCASLVVQQIPMHSNRIEYVWIIVEQASSAIL